MIRDITLGETHDFGQDTVMNGAPTALAGSPVVAAYPNNSDTQITAGITLSVIDGMDGAYNVRVVATSGNGYAAGSTYVLRFTAGTLGGVSIIGRVYDSFSIERLPSLAKLPAALVSGRMDSSTGAMAANVLTATAIAADAITDAKVASDVTIASVTGAVGSVTGNVGGNVTGSVGSVTGAVGSVASGGIVAASFAAGAIDAAAIAANAIGASELAADAVTEIQAGLATAAALTTIDDFLDTEVAAIKAVTDKLDTALVLDGAVYQYTANALELAPTGGSAPTVAQIADGVWDEALAGHVGAGSTGEALGAAGGAGDPWIIALPGAYGVGSAGKILGDRLDVVVSSRATPAQVNTEADTALADVGLTTTITGRVDAAISTRATPAQVNTEADTAITDAALATAVNLATVAGYLDTEVAAIKAKTDGLPTSPANEATLTTIAGYLDTEIAAIKAKTDGLPSDPADASDLAASFTTVNSKLDTIDDFLDLEIAAIKAKTDNLPASPAAVSNIPTALENADALLKRDMSAVTGEASRSPINALRFNRNKFTIVAGTLTVYEEDDTTVAWTAVITQTAGNPVSASDPA